MIYLNCGIFEACSNIVGFKIWKITEYFFLGSPARKHIENILYTHAHSAYAGTPTALTWVRGYSAKQIGVHERIISYFKNWPQICTHHTHKNQLSSALIHVIRWTVCERNDPAVYAGGSDLIDLPVKISQAHDDVVGQGGSVDGFGNSVDDDRHY